ncbi:hypothetical protein ACFLR4_03490 [Bacteroidota bacterium]
MNKYFLLITSLVFLLACSEKKSTIIFSVMGDVPRSSEEDILIQEHIKMHNDKSDSELMFHVGDIKSGNTPCDEDVYIKVADYLKELNIPTFIVPGDNEWNDCTDPETAWSFWVKYFMGFENNWKLNFKIERQSECEENFVFTSKNVLFIGINLVGGLIHDSTEWKERHNNNAHWIDLHFSEYKEKVGAAVIVAQANPNEKHVDFMTKFLVSAEQFAKPIIFIHGDGHEWIYEESWLKPNIIRIQVDKGGIAPPLKVILNLESEKIISFDRNQFEESD